MRNREWLVYTYLHRRSFERCARRLIREPALRSALLRRAKVHDMDKMILYLFLDQQTAQQLHAATQPHHLENDLPRTLEDLVETAIDYECAPYTKPDKPLNAYDFVRRLSDAGILAEDVCQPLLDILAQLGIARSGTVAEDAEGLALFRDFGAVTDDMLLAEILRGAAELQPGELERVMALAKAHGAVLEGPFIGE